MNKLLLLSFISLTITIYSCAQSAGGLRNTSAGDLKNADWFSNPFNKESAHHRPIGTGAVYAGDDDPATIAWLKYSFSSVNSPNGTGYGFSFYQIGPGFHETIIRWNRKGGDSSGFPVTLRLPPDLTAPKGGEGVVIVYDVATHQVHDFFHFAGGNSPAASIHKFSDIRGSGHPDGVGGARVGVSASGVEGFFGMMRGREINTPGFQIRHVAQFSLHWKSGPDLFAGYSVWPACCTDGSGKNQTGPIPYGTLLAIPPVSKGGPDLNTLGLSEPGLRLAESLRDYGGYAIDSTAGSVNMRADQDLDPNIRLQLINDLKKLFKFIRVVKNNAKNQTASGGGTPLAPNSAFNIE